MSAVVTLPVPISQVAGRYFLYDADVVTFIRREYHITGVLIGNLPQAPQQNVFSGIPLELMPEEVRLLAEKKVVYVIDDASNHRNAFRNMSGSERMALLAACDKQGREAARKAQNKASKRKEEALKRKGMTSLPKTRNDTRTSATSEAGVDEDEILFASPANSFPIPSSGSRIPLAPVFANETMPFGITPATSHSALALPDPRSESSLLSIPEAPPSYPLFKYLHDKGYFLSPGLRFGAQYMAYPGDPLRFHSHFLAVGKEWEEDWELGELVAGGRLGTGVKKGFLVGGTGDDSAIKGSENGEGKGNKGVRAFCVEWSGM
ncbi:MAG: hypothetical protein Q9165_005950 [Trypethelium subeluteriae]